MLARIAKNLVGRCSDDTIRRLAATAFTRTERQLAVACADPRAAQEARLQTIMAGSAQSELGKRHARKNLEAFRAEVPLSDWDSTAPFVERMLAGEHNVLVDEHPVYYATTSGTTGRRKLIPVTSGFVAECRTANRVLYRTMLQAMPGLVRGQRLSMRSPGTEVLDGGAEAGSITVALGGGVDDDNLLDAVPTAVFSIKDFPTRYAVAMRFALQARLTVAAAINPSTLQLFAETLATHHEAFARGLDDGDFGVDEERLGTIPDDIRSSLRARLRKVPVVAQRLRMASDGQAPTMAAVFPELAGLVTWKGGASAWWLDRVRTSYGDLPILDYGYAASEGCFGAPLGTNDASSLLLPHGHVVELLPEGETDGTKTVFLDEAEPGQRYEVVVTTSAGLWRYRMYDVVEVVGRHDKAPLAIFRHKAGTMCSITGEKLGEGHVAAALARMGFVGAGICLTPHYPAAGTPGYVAVVEARDVTPTAGAFAAALDAALMAENDEYRAKRDSLRLAPLVVRTVDDDAFVTHRRRRVADGAPDAHVKLPLLSVDGALPRLLGATDIVGSTASDKGQA